MSRDKERVLKEKNTHQKGDCHFGVNDPVLNLLTWFTEGFVSVWIHRPQIELVLANSYQSVAWRKKRSLTWTRILEFNATDVCWGYFVTLIKFTDLSVSQLTSLWTRWSLMIPANWTFLDLFALRERDDMTKILSNLNSVIFHHKTALKLQCPSSELKMNCLILCGAEKVQITTCFIFQKLAGSSDTSPEGGSD